MLQDDDLKIQENKDYFVIKEEIWKLLFAVYGGGPEIRWKRKNLERRL